MLRARLLRLTLCIALLRVAALPVTAAENAGELDFHVRDKDFKPTQIPDWVYERPMVCFVDTDQQIDDAAKVGIQVLHGGGASVYYPLLKDDPQSGLTEEQKARLDKRMEMIKRYDMKFVLAISPWAPPQLINLHPEWMVHRTADFSPQAELAANPDKPRGLCLNSPYGDFYIDCLAEIVGQWKVDGLSFDGNYRQLICHCPACSAAFKQDTGKTIPAKVDLNDIEYRIYMLWADGKLEQWYQKLTARMRRIVPEFVINTWTINAGRYGHYLTSPRHMSARLNMLFDCPTQEWWFDETNVGNSIVPAFGAAYITAVTGNRMAACEPYMMAHGNPYGNDSLPTHEAIAQGLLSLTNGALCAFFFSRPGYKEMSDAVMLEVGKRQQWLVRAERMPHAALLLSEQSRQFYGLNEIAERYLPHPFGVFRAAMEEHLGLNLITEWELQPGALDKYKVLILANSACLSDDQLSVIREFVRKGGGLVASCDTSLFDELGRRRADFGLADLFGVSYQGRPSAPELKPELDPNFLFGVGEDYWKQRTGIARVGWGDTASPILGADPRLAKLTPHHGATFKGAMVKVTPPKAPMQLALNLNPEGVPEALPGAVAGEFGKGRVVYMAAGIDGGYFSYSYPYQRLLLKNAIEWAANSPFPIEVQAPMCVQATFFRQQDDKGERAIVHLFNGISTTSGHGKPDVEVPMREESVPIHGIKVKLTGMNVKQFHVEPGNIVLEARQEGDAQVVEIPPLEIHSMLIAEL